MYRGFYGLLLIAACALLVNSYDFKDGDFNEIIMHEIAQFSVSKDGLDVIRRKRDADEKDAGDTEGDISSDSDDPSSNDKKCRGKGKYGKSNKCCNIEFTPEQIAQFDKIGELKKQCFQEIHGNKDDDQFDMFSCEKINKTKADFICVHECVSKKLGIADESGNLIDDRVKEHFKSTVIIAEHQKPHADEIITKCLQESKDATETPETEESGQKKCNPAIVKVIHCVWREAMKTCPKDLQINSPKCTKLRERLDKGEKIDFHSFHRFRGHKRSDEN